MSFRIELNFLHNQFNQLFKIVSKLDVQYLNFNSPFYLTLHMIEMHIHDLWAQFIHLCDGIH